MTMTYRVTWAIDLDADDPRKAAEEALRIQRDPESFATVFAVRPSGTYPSEDVTIDLWEGGES